MFLKVFRALNIALEISFYLGEDCGYQAGNKYDSTRELPCNLKARQGNGNTIHIKSESWEAHPNNQDSFSIPIFHLYECGLDAECDSNKCSLLKDVDVKCR